ncbi:hypothetical protein JXZ92_00510 [Mycoplasma sp. CSL10137]|uniref:hypothetical protein n=1 Tax=unclassified Mycoplasma TaxID=2683645 RepID=UPI00197C7716|nr:MULTISPECIES: hypothetical protein [unclassified Mycoplasma]MBN4083304.1 hypothetical protein [Mycoplasma sp. CSL10137]MBN4084393.1 hypothetical protein [Mycoplasma sp. CSL10166]MBU4692879.1 hypothetical protein [Mycoplasma sp. CSL7491-lung]MCU4706326.1 hypothetical protein [Mycoplasma sp. CSL7503-lung]
MKAKQHVIILINGKRRSGKGILSQGLKKLLTKQFEDNIHILSFAEPIKKITEPILDEIEWDKKDKEVVRPLWIAMGEVGRNINNNIWCGRVFERITEIAEQSAKENKNSLFIIDDLRFPNELDYFKKHLKDIQQIIDPTKEKHLARVIAIRIEKFMDANKFIPGVDDNSTEISFDKLVNLVFDYIVPQNTLINEELVADFKGVEVVAKLLVENYIKNNG